MTFHAFADPMLDSLLNGPLRYMDAPLDDSVVIVIIIIIIVVRVRRGRVLVVTVHPRVNSRRRLLHIISLTQRRQ